MLLKPEYRIVLIYLALGFVWILVSDKLVESLFTDPDTITFAQNLKGWFFVLITAAVLFLLIKRDIRKVTRINSQLLESYEQTIKGWIRVMDLRHKETHNHTQRVAIMTVRLAKLYGIRKRSQLRNIERGAILHDIGKIGIRDEILTKNGPLTEDEWQVMQTHPSIARDILGNIDYLESSLDIPYCHHEKWDGSGYPRGLKGTEIPLAARLFSVIDVWDALSHPRVYKDAWPEEKVLAHIADQSGRHFDPELAALFLDNYAVLKEGVEMPEQGSRVS